MNGLLRRFSGNALIALGVALCQFAALHTPSFSNHSVAREDPGESCEVAVCHMAADGAPCCCAPRPSESKHTMFLFRMSACGSRGQDGHSPTSPELRFALVERGPFGFSAADFRTPSFDAVPLASPALEPLDKIPILFS